MQKWIGFDYDGSTYYVPTPFEDHRKALPQSKRLSAMLAKWKYPCDKRPDNVRQLTADGIAAGAVGIDLAHHEWIKDLWAAWKKPRTRRGRRRPGTGAATDPAAHLVDEPGFTAQPTGQALDPNSQALLQQLLGIGGLQETITASVLSQVATNDDLIANVAARAGVPRTVVHTFPDRPDVKVDGVQHPKFSTLLKLIAGGARTWITGEAGVGKTYAVEQIAKGLGIPLFIVTPVGDKYELLGYKDANGEYQETELYRWATHEGPCMLLIDEIDGSQPNALISINAALANGLAVFPPGQVKVGPDHLVVATANTTGEGPSLKYNARLTQDGSLTDRFEAFLHWDLCEDTERMIAVNFHKGTDESVEASHRIRRNLASKGIDLAWGARRTYALGKIMACGIGVVEAAKLAGLSKLDDGQVARALEGVE